MITSTPVGRLPDGRDATLFTLTNANGRVGRLTDYGATLTQLHVPDRTGRTGDIVLGFDTLPPYLDGRDYLGATIGRVANRIAQGRLVIDGVAYDLDRNAGPHHLHGGSVGFDKRLWQATPGADASSGLRLTLESREGDQGYPGSLSVELLVRFTDDDSLVFEYSATTNRATAVSLTNHTYFNLAGSGDVLGHELQINGSRYLPTDRDTIPTGQIDAVTGTPLDFTSSAPIGAALPRLKNRPRGYDHAFVLDQITPVAARLHEPMTGRVVELSTTEPVLQLYTANYFDGTATGKYGTRYAQHAGVALEPGRYPDAPNQPGFPGITLTPGERYHQRTVYRFMVA